MTNKINGFTLEEIEVAQKFAELLVTLSKVGLDDVEFSFKLIKTLGTTTETDSLVEITDIIKYK